MTVLHEFANLVRETYGFLVQDYGFQHVIPEWKTGLESIVFKGAACDIEIGWYKGEIDFLFRVTRENDIFRPYVSREFSLKETLLFIDASAWNDPPDLPGWVISVEDASPILRYYATLIEKHCDGILKGDLHVFEAITERRKNKA